MLDPRGIQEFVSVVDLGGFTAAAEELDVSISFVSRQIILFPKFICQASKNLLVSFFEFIFYVPVP